MISMKEKLSELRNMENVGEISTVPLMEKQPVILGNQNGGSASSPTPALYVLVKQSTGKADQSALVANRDDSGLASSATTPVKPKVKTYLPADCTSGSTTVTLDNNNMWNEFYYRSTEMILTKQGRRMFPYCRYWITGLEANLKYILVMDISPVDNFRYKWNGHSWEPSGKAEPHVLGRVFIHPESPSTGHYWMHHPVSFYKLKLTNNTLDQEGHIILHSMHRYLPRLHLVPADKATEVIQLNGPDVHTFTFPQTEFFAVTAYQNIQITQLKIDYNPFAKGFRDDGLSSRLQRDVKQNGSSEQEGGSVTSSPSNHRHFTEDDTLDPEHTGLEPPFSVMCNTDLERESLSPYHDFLGFMETDVHGSDGPILKHEASESPISGPCQSISHMASPLNSNGGISGIKEEPVDDYDYGSSVCMEEIKVKQEEADNVAGDYSNNSHSILEQQLKRNIEMGKKAIEIGLQKRPQTSQLGVAKAKMLKLDSGKMPVVYLEPCAVTRNTIKVSTLSQALLSPTKIDESPLSDSADSLPTCFENNSISSPFAAMETEHIPTGKQLPESLTQKCSSVREMLWKNTETCSSLTITKKVSSCSLKTTAYSGPSLAKVISAGGKTNALKSNIFFKNIVGNQNAELPAPRKRGRPRKVKFPGVGRPPKYTGKSIKTSNYASLGPGNTHLDVKPDLEAVDGVLFVSFASKEALDIHTVDRTEEKELQNKQTPSLATCDPCIDPDAQRIQQLEKELLEDLKFFKYKQVIHPSLREVGLKLNFVDPTMSIDLKYLGVQLPLSYSDDYTLWKNMVTNSSSTDSGLPFVSRTGKTNDFTKIKGWRGKLHTSSKNEGIVLEGSLKNRSAFCSDKLDEYLENEGKLMETSTGFSPSTSSCPVVYQLPTKSTSYVRTLDSVLKKQSTVTTSSSSYTFKPLSVPSVSRKKREKVKNKKQAVSRSKEKSPHKPIIALPVVTKQKQNLPVLEEKVTKSQPSSQVASEINALTVPGIDENVQGKQVTVRQAQQQQQSSRLPSLSKIQLKLMDLEDCALWDGKPRTYITEERADLCLTTLLTAQASLKNKPIHKIIKRRAPPCNNDFCRLGCICSSLALEKRQPAHCRKPDCMFGCTCLKRKVVLVKGGSKHKKFLHGRHRLYRGKRLEQQEVVVEKEDEQEKLKIKDKRRKTKVEYTICDTEPEKPVKNFPLWVKVDGETDPEPVYIPTPSAVEPTKPLMPPVSEVLTSDNKSAASEVKHATSGVKSSRVYTPRPNPVIREEDKDPVYLYFERMMTCARVRIYERKTKEKRQQQKCPWNSEKRIEKENDSEPQSLKIEEDKEPGEKSWWFSCSAGDPSTSYVHHTTPGGRTKLIEIVSDCNWEEERNEILNVLSQHIKSKMPKSLKVGNFVIDLESETKTWDEKNTPIYSSRVKISMLSCQNKSEKAHASVLEAPNTRLSPCKRTETITFLTPGMLREQRKKGLPFYAGLSPAGKLIAYTCKYDLNPSCLIQVNGKNYPQAKLLLGQMGALHPASRLAAYLTGRLRPTMLDLSTISTVISKVASNAKVTSSEPQSTDVSTSETSNASFSTETTSPSAVTAPNVHASTRRQIAAQPLLDSVTSQLVMSAVGALQQKIPGIRTPQPLTGPQKFNIKATSISSGTTTVISAGAATLASLPVTISPSKCNTATNPSGIALASAVGKPENTIATTTATVKITKSTGIAAPLATIAFAKSVAAPSTPISTTSLPALLSTTTSTATVTTAPSSAGCVGPGPSGIPTSPLSNQKSGATSPPGLPPGAEKRMGPRLLLIPVHQGSPTLRPPQNMQLTPGKKMILQPLRNPGGVNLYRHPNGQIIQLVPLHQLQPAGPQPGLPSVMFRNPGSVVGIRLPGPSKPPETSVCQSSMTPTTTASSDSPMTPPALPTSPTTEATGTSTTTATSTTEATFMLSVPPAVLSMSPSADVTSVLSMSSTADSSLLPMPTSATPVPPIAEAVLPTTDASLVLPLSPITEAPSILSVPCTTEVPSDLSMPFSVATMPVTSEASSVLTAPSTADAPLVLPLPSSALPASQTTEAPSALPTSPTTNWTLQAIRSVSALSISAPQAAPVIPQAPVPVSQTGTLTLRISPAGIKSISTQTSSNSKIACSTSGQPNSAENLIAFQSGSFALLQFPGENVSSSTVKQDAPLDVKYTYEKSEFSAITVEEKTTCSQTVEAMVSETEMSDPKSEEIKLSESQPEFRSEAITCDRNAITLEIAEKDTEILEQLSRDVPISEPVASLSPINEKQTCEENEVMVKKKQDVKLPEDNLDEVSFRSETVPERCSQTAVHGHDTLQEQKITQLESSNEEQTHSDQIQSAAADSEEAEQIQLETEEQIIEQSWKPGDKPKVHMNCTEKLQEKTTSSLSTWGKQDPGPLERKMKQRSDSVATLKNREEVKGKPKITSAKNQNNEPGNKYLDSTQEILSKRRLGFQDNSNSSKHKKGASGIQEEKQSVKDELVQVIRTWNKISRQAVAFENKISMCGDELVEKFAECVEQNTVKTSHRKKDSPPIIDITMDDTEKDEKTDDSADEMVDEVSGYQSEDIVNVETLNESESSEAEENVDIETVEELSEKINIARLKATATHALLSKQLNLVRDHSNKIMAKTSKQSESSNKKPKNEEEAFANYRQTHTANERRRRKEMRGLFEKLKATLGLHTVPKVSKCFILKQAFEEIQGLTDQADKLTGQKNLLMRKQDTLIRKVSALSGKTQEVVLKKLEYIYAKQKAVEAQKKKRHQQVEPTKTVETTETAGPSVESSPPSVLTDTKPVILSNKRTKPLILSRKGSRVTEDAPSPVTLTNASLVMTANGQVLAFKSPLVPGQVATLPSTLLQAEVKSEIDSSNGTTQPGIASVMIQLPGSAMPVQVKGILPTSTIPITVSAVASNSPSPVVETAPELTSENEDSFMMPRIVNVTSLATEEDTNLNLVVDKNPYVTVDADSQTTKPSLQVVSQKTTDQSEEKAETSFGKERNATGTAQDFPQIVNVSSLKGSLETFSTKHCVEELAGSQARAKLTDKGSNCQKSKDSSFQKVQVNEPKDSGLEMELQKVASAIHEPGLDANDLMDIEENDDTDETLTSLLNEIAFLNQQLNDDASDISELPNSLSSGFSLGDLENRRESTPAGGSPFQFGAMGGSFKDLSIVRENSDSITPLLLHLDDDDLPEGNRNSGELSSESDALKIMLGSELKAPNPDLSAVNSGGSGTNVESLAKTRSVSPPILQMKTNLEAGNTDMTWRPMPKLAPLGLKASNFPLDSEGQNTKMMPSLAPVAAKEMKTAQPLTSSSQDPKAMLTLAPAATKSK